MLDNPPTISKIFAKTGTISCGPFLLAKDRDREISSARFWVNNTLITLPPANKRVMALLISKNEEPVKVIDFINVMDTAKFELMARKFQGRCEQQPTEKDIVDAENALTVRISQIKKAIRKAFDPEQAAVYNDMIVSITKQRHRQPHEQAGYRISLDA